MPSTASVQLRNDRRRALSNQPHPLRRLDPLAVVLSCHRNQEICSEGRPADHWYCVVSGVARRCATKCDGRRQILGLLLPGDFFGFTAHEEYDFAVEAIVEGMTIASYPRRRVEALADVEPELAREIREVAFETVSQLQAQLLILGRITATEKVASFLLAMAARSSADQSDKVLLPVSRYDIADCLTVSVETVSRSLTDLKHRGLISLLGTRTVRIVDREGLAEARLNCH